MNHSSIMLVPTGESVEDQAGESRSSCEYIKINCHLEISASYEKARIDWIWKFSAIDQDSLAIKSTT